MSTYKFSVDTPPIPAADQFRLDLVLASLAPETQDVVDLMVGVSRNYQKDVRDEFKRSLTREQQIQMRNIKVAKMTKLVTKRMAQALPLPASIGAVGTEVNELLMVTTTTNTRLKAVLNRLESVEFDPARFPKLAQLMKRKPTTTETESPFTYEPYSNGGDSGNYANGIHPLVSPEYTLEPVDHPQLQTTTNTDQSPDQSPLSSARTSVRELTPQPPSFTLEPERLRSPITNTSPEPILSPTKASESSLSPEPSLPSLSPSQTPLPRQNSLIDPLEPITLTSSSLSGIQSPLLNATKRTPRKPFVKVESQEPMSPQQFEEFMAQSINQYRRKKTLRSFSSSRNNSAASHNPINLLYSSLMSHPKYVDPIPKLLNPNPFSSVISIKLLPTAIQTFQTSHFKKLRINGDPITSATFVKAQARKNDLQQHHQQNPPCECAQATPAIKALEMLSDNIADIENVPGTPPCHSPVNLSPPQTLPLKRGSDDDIWTTVDSEGLDLLPPRQSTSSSAATPRTPLLSDADVLFEKDNSPTPKHRPSHHTLKPKRLILKTSLSGQAVPIKKNKLDAAKYLAPLALSEINLAYDGRNNLLVTSFSANGILLPVATGDYYKRGSPPDNDDNRSILSISNLKQHLEDY